MKKFIWLLYQPYKWIIFAPFVAINTIIFGILAVLLSLLINQKTGSYVGGALWSRINVFFTPVWVKTYGKENIHKKQSYVIVANHLSAYDIFILYGWLGIDFKWVMKKEIRKIPGIGFGSEAVGHIFIDRSSSKAAIETIEAAKKRIRNGTSVVFFPEGTRSRTGQMLPFKKGAFKFAYDLGLPILPVTILGTDRILPTNSLNLMPGKAKIIIHPAVDIHQFSEEALAPLMEHIKEVIASSYDHKSN